MIFLYNKSNVLTNKMIPPMVFQFQLTARVVMTFQFFIATMSLKFELNQTGYEWCSLKIFNVHVSHNIHYLDIITVPILQYFMNEKLLL